MSTKIRPFNLHTSVDSHVKGLIDSDYIQARQTAGTDSASTQAMIDSNFANMDTSIHIPDGSALGAGENKITFGNDSDLKIYHDASNSHIAEVGTGDLNISGSNNIIFKSSPTGEFYAIFRNNGAAELYHNNNKKLETLDSGANVTGNIAANIRSNPKGFSVTHTVDSSDNALLVGPINVDSGVTLTINGTLMVV